MDQPASSSMQEGAEQLIKDGCSRVLVFDESGRVLLRQAEGNLDMHVRGTVLLRHLGRTPCSLFDEDVLDAADCSVGACKRCIIPRRSRNSNTQRHHFEPEAV